MTTVTVKIPERLNVRLAVEAERKQTSKSAVIRRLLENALISPRGTPAASCHKLSRDLCGSVRGAPRDLSTNKKHLEGYDR